MDKKTFQRQTRILLQLWNLAGVETDITAGKINKVVKKSNESSKDYQKSYRNLEEIGAIAVIPYRTTAKVSLTQQGLQVLRENLQDPQFEYGSRERPRVKDVNAILKWFQQYESKAATAKVSSYDEFKKLLLQTFEQVDREYNCDGFVPIYQVRRSIGDQVDRSSFNEWLVEMQRSDLIFLEEGSVSDNDPSKIEDSITTPLSGLRCYITKA
ncbi:MAG: hypothetical protein HC799_14205 [Limnothrix sp. RL_2_0]|nr:hypothetical protein [Limnothrix sp. RL_2_0]